MLRYTVKQSNATEFTKHSSFDKCMPLTKPDQELLQEESCRWSKLKKVKRSVPGSSSFIPAVICMIICRTSGLQSSFKRGLLLIAHDHIHRLLAFLCLPLGPLPGLPTLCCYSPSHGPSPLSLPPAQQILFSRLDQAETRRSCIAIACRKLTC